MVQGENYENFALNVLELFFMKKIEPEMEKITKYNNDVKDALGATKPLNMETKAFTCPQCERKTKTKGDLKLHMKSCHTKPGLSSPKRSKMLKINNGIEAIKMIEMMAKNIDVGDKIIEKNISDKKSTIIQQPIIENLHSCYFCDFDTEFRGDLDNHLQKVHGNQFISVSEHKIEKAESEGVNCLEGVMNNEVDDVEEIHEGADNTFVCNTCTLSFKRDADLKGHLGTHIKPQAFHCEKCEETFGTELEYEGHIETVHEQQTFSCGKCKYQTQTENDLNTHFQIKHMDTKVTIESEGVLVKCNICEYRCKLNIQLNNHKKRKHPAGSMQHNCREYIKHEMETMRKELKEAFENFADLVGEVFGNYKNKSDTNFHTLSETVLKLGERYKKLEKIHKLKTQNRKSKDEEKNDISRNNLVSTKSYSSVVKGSSSTSSTPQQTISSSESTFLPSRRKQSSYLNKPKTLYVADSVGQSLSLREVEAQQHCRIFSAGAESSVFSNVAKWPKQNFSDVVKSRLQNQGREKFEALIMSAPTVDITNLDVNISKTALNIDKLQNEARISSQNMFSLAERSLRDNPSLKKVVIMEHPPRFDLPDSDPHSVKPNLAKVANIHLGQMWLNSPLKDKIFIGRHSLESPGVGVAHFRRYQNSFTGRYDGVHLYGQRGYTDPTNSVKTILSLALPVSHQKFTAPKPREMKVKVESDNHTNCPQTLYQCRMAAHNKYHPSIQISNRFDALSQGNF